MAQLVILGSPAEKEGFLTKLVARGKQRNVLTLVLFVDILHNNKTMLSFFWSLLTDTSTPFSILQQIRRLHSQSFNVGARQRRDFLTNSFCGSHLFVVVGDFCGLVHGDKPKDQLLAHDSCPIATDHFLSDLLLTTSLALPKWIFRTWLRP